jgi:electron transport complex protein RnfG
MNTGTRQILITGLILFMFAMIGALMVASTFEGTAERIAENERLALLRKLNRLVPPDSYDNNLLQDSIEVRHAHLLGTADPVTAYPAWMGDTPVAIVIAAEAPDGYSGRIRLLVGIRADGTLGGVRVVSHRETPGLGDAIEEQRSDWIYGFDGKSLQNPSLYRWKVRKDGGDFDQLTGATITPRAIVTAVRNALLYYRDHGEALFREKTETREAPAQDTQAQP